MNFRHKINLRKFSDQVHTDLGNGGWLEVRLARLGGGHETGLSTARDINLNTTDCQTLRLDCGATQTGFIS